MIRTRYDDASIERVLRNVAELGLLDLMSGVATRRRVLIRDLLSRTHCPLATAARYELWNVVHDSMHPISFPEIGRIFERDHATVMRGIALRQVELNAEMPMEKSA
jgi:chromosomal replication initiation ATPase DnaA